MMWKCPHLWEITVLQVCAGHAIQPRPSQFGGACIGAGQAVLEVQQHLRVLLMLLHLGRGHQHRSDALSQTFDFQGERCRLEYCKKNGESDTLVKNAVHQGTSLPGRIVSSLQPTTPLCRLHSSDGLSSMLPISIFMSSVIKEDIFTLFNFIFYPEF